MDGNVCLLDGARRRPRALMRLLPTAQVSCDAPDAAAQLSRGLGPAPLALVVLFIGPQCDVGRLARDAADVFGPVPVIGCTTAGEIGPTGYEEGQIVALGLPAGRFAVSTLAIEGLSELDPALLSRRVMEARQALATHGLPEGFAMLLVDGLSAAEDTLTAALAPYLDGLPLVGGSAGDGERYERTSVLHGGRAMSDAAVLALVHTDCRVRPFQTDHLIPTHQRMVVTGADPAARVVTEIDAEPAAREYARLIGMRPEDLTVSAFALNPLVVHVGGRHHVRAVQRVEGNHLRFFGAIDEGVVLTLARTGDLVAHLEAQLAALGDGQAPAGLLAFDCLLRRIEARERQVSGRIGAVLRRHGAVGFSTYGEQLGAMHVNQTLTGLAIWPPGAA